MTAEALAERLKVNGIPCHETLAGQLMLYLSMLQDWNTRMDLTAVLSEEEMADKHFMDSLTVLKTPLLSGARSLIDVGTGAGFPGLVLAMALPDVQVTLLDAQMKRLSFLQAVCDAVKVKNVRLVHARAEDGGRQELLREKFDVAVARAVAPLNVLCELLLPFVRLGGRMVCWKGPALKEELQPGEKAAHILGGKPEQEIPAPVAGQDWEHVLFSVRKVQVTPRAYPRKAGTPKTRPLGET